MVRHYHIEDRHAICLSCDHSSENARYCDLWKEGCFEKERTKFETKCPLGKWKEVDASSECKFRSCRGCHGQPECGSGVGGDCDFGIGSFYRCEVWRDAYGVEKLNADN